MSRLQVAIRVGVAESVLRLWESDRVLPPYCGDLEQDYEVMVRILAAARAAGLSGQKVRRVLTVEGDKNGETFVQV